MSVLETRGTSVHAEQPAAEILSWFERQWKDLNATEKLNAVFEVRPFGDNGYMVGLKWTHESENIE